MYRLFCLLRDKLRGLGWFKTTTALSEPALQGETPLAEVPAPSPWTPEQYVVEPVDGKTRFLDLGLSPTLLHAIAEANFHYCTPIQAETLPQALQGRDIIGQAQTGTGKTAAFMITIIQRLHNHCLQGTRPLGTPRALVLAPTRELVLQIIKDTHLLTKYTPFKVAQVFGGMDYHKQQAQFNKIVDILIATPGRLLDFQRHKQLDLSKVEILVLDEADRMLDMGFLPEVWQIVRATPVKGKRQTLLFSATFPDKIRRAADSWTLHPLKVAIEPQHIASQNVKQLVYITTNDQKYRLLYNLITQQHLQRVLIFANRRSETRFLTDQLRRDHLPCAMLSGDIAQGKRIKTLEDFKNGKLRVLVATDVAGRGLHIDGISHVINYTLPSDPEDYVHRIGRTGRAGAVGTSISFATEDDSFNIPAIEALLGQPLRCIHPDERLLEEKIPPSSQEVIHPVILSDVARKPGLRCSPFRRRRPRGE